VDTHFRRTGIQYPLVAGIFFPPSVILTASITSVLSDSMCRLSLEDQATSYVLNIRDVIPGHTVTKVYS
jgi:hypothetical protein